MLEYNCEFHCHTIKSYDGFININILIEECKNKNINVIAITDHDILKISKREVNKIKSNNIELIKGCEFTLLNGCHLIGLFIENVKSKLTAKECVDFILEQGGKIYIPHPFNKETGIMQMRKNELHEMEYILCNSTFIELYNGGYDSSIYIDQILEIANKYNLKIVGGSDSHKPWHIGYYVNHFTSKSKIQLTDIVSYNYNIKINRNSYKRRNSELNSNKIRIKKHNFYKIIILVAPKKLKRIIKIILFYINLMKYKNSSKNIVYDIIYKGS